MSSRFASTKVLDYCYHPITLIRNGQRVCVPCGKCNGCVLHKANTWSRRLQDEIESHPFNIFATYTYSNEYLPVLRACETDNFKIYSEYPSMRWNGSKYVLRKDNIEIIAPKTTVPISITNFHEKGDFIPYSSKNDFQLYLKLLRKDLYEHGYTKSLRYYAISEYGETLFRPHVHAIIFCDSEEETEYLLHYALYQNWKMCDKTRFDQYCKLCTGTTAQYLTNYVSSTSRIPQILCSPQIQPFRLSSKGPAIGYFGNVKEKIFEDVSRNVATFIKRVPSVDTKYVFRYPKDFMLRLFPKCYRYSLQTYSRLQRIYGLLFRCHGCFPNEQIDSLLSRLRNILHPLDYEATRKCYYTCLEFGITPDFYVHLLTNWYYQSAMFVLRNWYARQEELGFSLDVLNEYINWKDYVFRYKNYRAPPWFIELLYAVGLTYEQFLEMDFNDLVYEPNINIKEEYMRETDNIVSELYKMPKFNEKFGFSPNSPNNLI